MYSFMEKRYSFTFLLKKGKCNPRCPPVCIYDQVFVHTKFSMPYDSHMDAQRFYGLTLIQVYF